MFNMEKLTNVIGEKISQELGLDNDHKEVISYGAFAILQTALSIILVAIFGAIFGVLIESLIVAFSISILRKYSGGVHASSPGICAAWGTVIAIGQALLIYFVVGIFVNLKIIIFLGLISFAWSFYIIDKLAPVDTAAKPIRSEKKRKRMKKGSIIVLGVYVVIIIINIIEYLLTNEKRFLIFSLCIYGGTVWQAFTLTNAGHLIFQKIDSFFNQLSTFTRGEK